ncbi:MAG TPA: IPT/TIG domain-containing protein, partial [Acidimicrobiales bacterium]|nr:IPT/TIG domain-containing protein [Acidimicrobiales bacterium]
MAAIPLAASIGVANASAADPLEGVPSPTITGISPDIAGAGSTVTISGTDFCGVTVQFGSQTATVTNETPDSLEVTVPSEPLPPPTNGQVEVTVNDACTTEYGPSNSWLFSYAPTVTSISPTSGPAAGGTSVTIEGANLASVCQVEFGSTVANNFLNGNSILAVSPAGSGTVNIVVTSCQNGTRATSPIVPADQFTYISPPPTVTSISPSSGSTAGETIVTIDGTNLGSACEVRFGEQQARISSVSPNGAQVIAISPPGSGTVDVQVGSSCFEGGPTTWSTANPADQFTYVSAVSQVLVGITVKAAGSSSTYEIVFQSPILLGGTTASGTWSITVEGPAGTSFPAKGCLIVNLSQGDDLSDCSLAPNGDTVVISVPEDFPAPRNDMMRVSIIGVVNPPPGTYRLSLSTYAEPTPVSSNAYQVVPATPTVTSVSPSSGLAGTTVTIAGANLGSACLVEFGSTAAHLSSVSSSGTQVLAVSPPGSGTVDVVVGTSCNADGTPAALSATSAADQFTYVKPSLPIVTGISPSSGPAAGGAPVTIDG